MMRYISPLIVFGLLIAVFIKGLDPERDLNALPSPFLGQQAPHLDLPKLKNLSERVSSEDYKDVVSLVNVWATWCVGCRQEHEFLKNLANEDRLPIYGINWRDRRDDALEWLEVLGDPYVASGYDHDGRVGIDWGVYGAPETFLLAADGTVLYKHLSPLTMTIWEKEFMSRMKSVSVEQR